jgi:sugar lactone lactonase YvrE
VAADRWDNVYVADTSNHRIQKFDSDGRLLAMWGSFGTVNGRFYGPSSVAIDSSDNVYVVDMGNSRIQKLHIDGTFLTNWGSLGASDGQFNNPSSVAIDTSGKVYVVDKMNSRVQKFGSLAITAEIDIKPGKNPNKIKLKSKGVIPVAILTTYNFDATTVDPLSILFGPSGAPEAHGRGHIEDVDGDGDADLVLHFRTRRTGIRCGDTSVSLTGETFSGKAIEGSDSIKAVKCK